MKVENGSETDLTPSINVFKSSRELVHSIFPDISNKYTDKDWLTSRAILVPTNSRLHDVNDQVSQFFPGVFRTYMSADSVVCDDVEAQKCAELNYPQELLNSIEAGSSLPDHEINLKEGFVVMLLRNIRPRFGHVNGTRYIVERMTANFLFLISASGTHKGSRLSLPRMNCAPGTDEFPIPGFRRRQFPIRICFSMTVNKALGQSVTGKLGVDLTNPCLADSQLYVALSRATHAKDVYIYTTFGHHKTKNVVCSEVLTSPTVSRSSHTVLLPVKRKQLSSSQTEMSPNEKCWVGESYKCSSGL